MDQAAQIKTKLNINIVRISFLKCGFFGAIYANELMSQNIVTCARIYTRAFVEQQTTGAITCTTSLLCMHV